MRLLDGKNHLLADLFFEYIVGIGCVSPCINNRKFSSAPLAPSVVSVARYSCCFVNDGLPHAHEAVEKSGLAHIWASYNSQ